MNAVEIEEAVSDLVAQPFHGAEFPYEFLAAFGMKDTTLKRLRSGSSNASDVAGGVLQRNNIHVAVSPANAVGATLAALRDSPKTASAKAKFILATDGAGLEAEDLVSGEAIACDYADLAQHFGFFLPLAGISTVKEIKDNPIDVKATGRLNKLYVELLKDNPDWATEARRPALNQFMARLIFCFFAEDTGIFEQQQFTDTISQMSDGQSDNTHEVLTELFRAMDLRKQERTTQNVRSWADKFPYVNGGLFTGASESPRFSRIARSYLLRAGELNWKEINPDIFGSMIQAVADDRERGNLGMHYTSVPNILKVLNPLFLDDLNAQLEAAGDNQRKLKNLRKRLSTIRVFDPACGSGNFLVVAYKCMRAIEAEILRRLANEEKRSAIELSHFYGIEIEGFAVEITRLSLLIAEFQADCLYLSQREARALVLPLHTTGQIRVGNALRIDWLTVCAAAPAASAVQESSNARDDFGRESDGIDRESAAETYVCGNPPYKGSQWQSASQKADLEVAFNSNVGSTGALDYVAGWFIKACEYLRSTGGEAAFVTTNSVNQGRQVALLWQPMFDAGISIRFADRSFTWSNLAQNKAGVTVSVVGITSRSSRPKVLLQDGTAQQVRNISPYLVSGDNVIVKPLASPISDLPRMTFGSMPNDDGWLLLSAFEAQEAISRYGVDPTYIRPIVGSQEFIQGIERRCLWIPEEDHAEASSNVWLKARFDAVRQARSQSARATTKVLADSPFRFGEVRQRGTEVVLAVPGISSENRNYLPCGLLAEGTIITNKIYALFDAPLWNIALIASRLHWVWIATVCVRLRTDFSYSNTLGWNTFPVPTLTDQNKAELTHCAENILLARESHFPETIADLYNPEAMPENIRRAHEANDEVLERIYIGRRFRNDTERLEKLFELYTKMIATLDTKPPAKRKARTA